MRFRKSSLLEKMMTMVGYRVTFKANYMNSMPVIMKIDITTGDKITYKEIKYTFDLMLEDRKIDIWSYNLETIIAEKYVDMILNDTNVDDAEEKINEIVYSIYNITDEEIEDIEKEYANGNIKE